jgi:hypothetical protein
MVKPAAGASQVTLPTITIQADGSVSPADVPIHQSGNTYTFTGNIYGALNIFKSNIVLNGAGYALRGSFSGNSTDIWIVGTGPSPTLAYYTIGVDLANGKVDGVTVENLNIENFSIGAYVWTKNNTVAGNSFSRCIVGLLMSGSNSTITRNYIANNIEGLFFGFNSPSGQFPPDMVVYENAFINNNKQISGCQCKAYNMSETPHDWDNGKVGNYWSDYNCTSSHNGVGDTPYVIDVLDRDLYPLMQNPVKPPAPPQQVSLPVEAIVVAVFVSAALAVAFLAFWRRRGRKTERSEKLESISLTNSEWPLSHLRGT